MKLPRSTAFRRPLIAGLLGGLCFAMLATWPAAGIVLGPMCALALLLGVVQPIGYGRVVFTASAVLLCVATLGLGLRPLPDWAPGALPLSALALTMLLLDAMAHSREHPPLPRAVRALTATALALTSVLALLAGLAVTTRVGQYGWTPKRVLAAAAAAFALCWSLVWLAAHIRRWRGRPLAHAVPSVAALVLGLLLLIALQSPLLDPQRITVNSQMARLESGAAHADDSVVQVFEEAGTLGQAALAELRTHPQWLENPDRQTLQLAHRQGMNSGASSAHPAPELLKRYLRLRENSAPPPATWWQGIDDDTAYRVANCLAVEGQCTVWSMPMTDDGETAVLLFDPKANDLYLFAQEGGHWAIAGSIGPSAQGSSGADHLLHGKLGTQPKRWHDLTVDGQRYRVDYFNDR